jgi:putative effector of murein hydrolase
VDVTETGETLSQATGGAPINVLAGGAVGTIITGIAGAGVGKGVSSKNKKRNTAIGAVTGVAAGIAGTAGALAVSRGKARIKPTTGA